MKLVLHNKLGSKDELWVDGGRVMHRTWTGIPPVENVEPLKSMSLDAFITTVGRFYSKIEVVEGE